MWKKCLGVILDKKMGGFLDTLDPPFATQADDIRRLLRTSIWKMATQNLNTFYFISRVISHLKDITSRQEILFLFEWYKNVLKIHAHITINRKRKLSKNTNTSKYPTFFYPLQFKINKKITRKLILSLKKDSSRRMNCESNGYI